MKRRFFCLLALVVFFFIGTGLTMAAGVNLYVDAAPNVYGSPLYPAWQDNAFSTASNGSFVNMEHSFNLANSGTTNFEIEDATVYSFGDLGKRLSFVYWVPGETISSLIAKNFGITMSYVWDGSAHNLYEEYYGQTWLQPSRWEEYNGGVIGVAGFAWWGAYNINTPEALASDLLDWDRYQGDITLFTRLDGQSSFLTAHHSVSNSVPETSTWMLMFLGVCGLIGLRKKILL